MQFVILCLKDRSVINYAGSRMERNKLTIISLDVENSYSNSFPLW